ncbi:MAG TPA: 6-phosphogluconolactonase [Balneolaceae bacterium]|nr:6-phosphogluconolactonase [Balneolaceae bacterium]
MKIEIYPDPETLSKHAAHLFADTACEAVDKWGRFTVALSGGSSPEQTYKLLASEPFKSKVPWERTWVFWGDERFVPPDDPENNARMAREILLDHVPVPAGQIFPIPTDSEPELAVKHYSKNLISVFGERPKFDLILLGLGGNGHTASLFPETDILDEQEKLVDSVYLQEKNQYRISLTAPVINNARKVAFLVFGKNKAETVHEVLDGKHQPKQLPAQLIKPSGQLYWLLDEDAASLLEKEGK